MCKYLSVLCIRLQAHHKAFLLACLRNLKSFIRNGTASIYTSDRQARNRYITGKLLNKLFTDIAIRCMYKVDHMISLTPITGE